MLQFSSMSNTCLSTDYFANLQNHAQLEQQVSIELVSSHFPSFAFLENLSNEMSHHASNKKFERLYINPC